MKWNALISTSSSNKSYERNSYNRSSAITYCSRLFVFSERFSSRNLFGMTCQQRQLCGSQTDTHTYTPMVSVTAPQLLPDCMSELPQWTQAWMPKILASDILSLSYWCLSVFDSLPFSISLSSPSIHLEDWWVHEEGNVPKCVPVRVSVAQFAGTRTICAC